MTELMALDAKALEAAMAAHRGAVVTMDACPSCMGNGFVVTGGDQEPCAWCGGAAEVAPNAEREMMASAIAAYLQTLPTIVRWEHRLWYDDTSSWSTWRDGKNPKIVDNRFEERPLFALPPPATEAAWTPEKYAEQLAVLTRQRCYPEVPQFKPMTGDIMGLLSQIDNMLTGMVRALPPPAAEEGLEPVAWLGYWPGMGSVNSTTSTTHLKHDADRWREEGAEVTPLVVLAAAPIPPEVMK